MRFASILVTGTEGFVGGALARKLRALGAQVVGTDLRNVGGFDGPFVEADLGDTHRLYRLLALHPVDAIVHCGGVSGSMLSIDNPMHIVRSNVLGTANVLEVARATGVRRVVFCSSASVYGAAPGDPVVEDSPLHPISVYGASKIAGEALLESYATQFGLDGVALRIFQVYGPGRTTECQIRSMLMGGLKGRIVDLAFSPNTQRQYVHVDDVVDAAIAALRADRFGRRSYNVSGDASITLQALAERVAGIVPGTRVRFSPKDSSPPNERGQIDISAARHDLGFEPKVSLSDGILRYADWLRSRLGQDPDEARALR